ncbi:hypothetical protein DP73_03635 [Desulfosporosinus sp. HMP52]|uniref:hypothetical protein n=1 Tax=Desulfosporosinus sp. HMP52 TaxID=1487923 RepID=UPI00051FC0C0|nr:hypothetical protein [Desulfosporosinus sp. HMP52]KGK91370.1 hypothetical protein DP73_03635 [Desulfosporosinus sp. HMP52]
MIDPKDRAASIHSSELIAWRGSKAYKAWVGSVASGSPQVLPRGLVKLPPMRVGEPRSAEYEDTVFARISWSCTDVDETAQPRATLFSSSDGATLATAFQAPQNH